MISDDDPLFSASEDDAVAVKTMAVDLPETINDGNAEPQLDAEKNPDAAGNNRMEVEYDDDEEEDDIDDDPILHEIPVFVSNALAESLYIFQYPTRKTDHPTPVAARFKPLSQRFELDVPIDTANGYYDKDRGEKFGFGTNNDEKVLAKDYDKHRNRVAKPLDQMTLHSSLPPTSARYMAGTVRDGEIHLTPVSAIVQLRPTLKYMDKIAEKEKAATTKLQQEDGAGAPVEEAKVVQMRVIQADDKDATKRKTTEQTKIAYEAEQWMALNYKDDRDSLQAIEEYEKLLSQGDNQETTGTPVSYLDDLSPITKLSRIRVNDKTTDFKKLVRPGLSIQELKLLPLNYQILGLIMNANAIQHSNILELLKIEDNEETLRAIEQAAVLVRGVWVLRSETIYYGRVANARKVLLHLFNISESGLVSRQQLNEIANLPLVMMTNIFHEIAFYVKRDAIESMEVDGEEIPQRFGGGWMLKSYPDQEFCKKYPDIVEKQNEIVRMEAEAAVEAMEKVAPTKAAKNETSKKDPPKKEKILSASATASSAGGPGSSGEVNELKVYNLSGATPKEQMLKLIRAIFSDHGICSEEYLHRAIVESGSQAVKGNLLTVEELSAEKISSAIDELCFPLHGVFALKVLNNGSDNFRTAILELFKSKRSGVKKADVFAACLAATTEQPPQNVYAKVMKELAVSSGPAWELKSSPSL